MNTLKILLNQQNSIGGPVENEKRIKEVLKDDFDIAIFPELFYSGYMRRDNIRFYHLDPSFLNYIQKNIGDRMLIFGAPVDDRFFYNSAIVINAGKLFRYYKMHLPNFGPFEEYRYFSKGTVPFAVDFRGIKINVNICYDLFFYDSYVKGSDVIVNISASPFTSRSYFERVFPGKAIENQAYLIYVNTSGLQRNQVFWGGSRILDPDGKMIFKLPYFMDYSGSFSIDIDSLKDIRQKRRVLDEVLHEHKE